MAQDPNKPKDDLKIKLPKVDGAMNKIAPDFPDPQGGKNGRKAPPLSASSAGGEDDPQVEDGLLSEEDPLEQAKGIRGEEKEEILARIRKRFDRCIQAESENRKAAIEDLKFLAGDQWPADIMATRNAAQRPCLTINKLPVFVEQVTNDERQNRPAINVSPVGDRADVEVAKMYKGLIKAIERDSTADIAYDTAFESCTRVGFGYWRILTDYESPTSFDQVIRIQRIRNAMTVYLDPDRQEPDGADASFGFITDVLPRDEFEAKYPDADPMPFTMGGIGDMLKNWVTSDTLRVAEYFESVPKVRTLVKLSNGHIGWEEDLSDVTREHIASGVLKIVNSRQSESHEIKWYKVTAKDILESRDWPGMWIPIVQVIGREIDIEGKVKLSGVIRFAKDPQRMVNYWETSFTELVALQPKAPFVMEEGQVEGHEQQWKQANTQSMPYLLYRGVNLNGKPAPPPQRQPFGGIPAGVQQALQNSQQNMIATTGIRFDATLQERTYDESGAALHELRRSGDLQSFHYVDNMARALKHCGRQLVDLIPKIYDTRRMVTILREDDVEEQVQINPQSSKPMAEVRNPNTEKMLKIFNPTMGKYGVTVTIGPSHATKRIEASKQMMEFIRAIPTVAPMVADLVAKNQDWPGGPEFTTRLAKVVAMQHPGVMSADIRDVPPQVQAMLTQMDAQIKQMMQERVQMVHALKDKADDRALQLQRINQDFEAKLLKIVADMESKTMATQQRALSSFETHIAAEVKALGEHASQLAESIMPKAPTDTPPAAPTSA